MGFTIINKKTKKTVHVTHKDVEKYPVDEWDLFHTPDDRSKPRRPVVPDPRKK